MFLTTCMEKYFVSGEFEGLDLLALVNSQYNNIKSRKPNLKKKKKTRFLLKMCFDTHQSVKIVIILSNKMTFRLVELKKNEHN